MKRTRTVVLRDAPACLATRELREQVGERGGEFSDCRRIRLGTRAGSDCAECSVATALALPRHDGGGIVFVVASGCCTQIA